uniref:Uncharacterized protein n=1 Tax=Eutreptiella gymnastica TaxID=73025 RepID=A0A7S1NNI7_9EUGL
MPVRSLPEDKPKIVFHAVMMAIQNFGFFVMYYGLWGATPHPGLIGDVSGDPCSNTRFATGFMALTCFCEAFLCIGMAFGGYTDDKTVFTLYWFAHLVGGLCYIFCTGAVPAARFSDEGKACAKLSPSNGDRVQMVWIVHAVLFMVYVGGMLSITYFSFLKPTFFSKKVEDGPTTLTVQGENAVPPGDASKIE